MNPILKGILRLFVSSILLGLLFWKMPLANIWTHLKNVELSWFFLSLVLGEVVMFNMALRWKHLILVPEFEKPTISVFFRFTAVGYLFNLLLPTGFGGDAVKSWMFGKKHSAMAASVASTALARALGFAALVGLFWIGSLITWDFHWLSTLVMVGFSFALIAAWIMVTNRKILQWLQLGRTKIHVALYSFVSKLREYYNKRNLVAIGLIDSLAMQFVLILIQWCFFQSSGANVALVDLLVLIPIVTVATMIPISIYGIGFREWAILTFIPVGYSSDMVLAGVALGYALVLFQAMQGALFFFWGRSKGPTLP